jgi:hypothetical protein
VRTAAAALALAAAACARDEPREPPAAPPAREERTVAPAPPPAPDTGISVLVRKTGERAYSLSGRTGAAAALELTVEDGHSVLYGPAEVPVTSQSFRIDLEMEPTSAPTVFAYFSDPRGARQWVVPIPRDVSEVTYGAPLPGAAP